MRHILQDRHVQHIDTTRHRHAQDIDAYKTHSQDKIRVQSIIESLDFRILSFRRAGLRQSDTRYRHKTRDTNIRHKTQTQDTDTRHRRETQKTDTRHETQT